MTRRWRDWPLNELHAFVKESNLIEGIARPPTLDELEAHREFLRQPEIDEWHLSVLVDTVQPDAVLRAHAGLDVRVGNHRPPPGGPGIVTQLNALLDEARSLSPFELYCRYETLHPFTDGNGRSGRALWLWRMGQSCPSFLRQFHYQALEAHDSR